MKSTITVVRGLPDGETIDPDYAEYGQRFKRTRFTGADEVEDPEVLGQMPLVRCERCHELVCGETLENHPCTPVELACQPETTQRPGADTGSSTFYTALEAFERKKGERGPLE